MQRQEVIRAKIFQELRGDLLIWLIVSFLAAFSLMAVYSSTESLAYQYQGGNTEYYMIKHLMLLLGGFALTYACHQVNYIRYSKVAPLLLVVAVPLLLFTLFYGYEINEARRWLPVPGLGITIQSSDFAKLALIIYVARSIAYRQEVIKDFRDAFVPIIVPILIICALIAPADLSTAMLLFVTCLTMMFIGRIDIKYIAVLIVLGIFLLAIIVALGYVFDDIIRVSTWASRIDLFFNDAQGGYQIEQAKIAIAEGGLFGVGPGQSTQSSYLPFPYADFIYAIICEEYGLMGGCLVIVLYLMLIVRCIRLVTRSPKTFGAMLAIGLGLSLVFQAFAHIAVSVHLVPATGLTLPLISMGGTSILFTCISFGIILSVSKYIEHGRSDETKVAVATSS